MKIVILVINYANEEEVLEYAKTISRQSISKDLSLVVVNNKSSECPKIDLKKEMESIQLDIKYYEPGKNLGYLNGVLYGYREYCNTKKELPDYAVISNTDIIINDTRFFEKFSKTEYPNDVACIAPSITSGDNKTYLNPHYTHRIPKRKIDRLILINNNPFFAFLYYNLSNVKAKLLKRKKQNSQYVYSPHGCFFFLKKEFMELIKNNFYKGFLYSEESYIAELILKNNFRCYYDSNINLIHNESSVTGLLSTKRKAKYYANSLKIIKDEFY